VHEQEVSAMQWSRTRHGPDAGCEFQRGLPDPGFRVDSRRRYALSSMIEPGRLAA
jgi:hypothetical protein